MTTTHQTEIWYGMWIDSSIDLYRIYIDGVTLRYDVYEQTVEVIDVGGLFWTILGMPFAFISQAFNLTFFPGTPYSINVANLIFTIIGALILIFIIRRFTR